MFFDVNFIVAQVFGIIVIILGAIIAPHLKTKTRLLICDMIAILFQATAFLLLGAMTGVFALGAIMSWVIVLFLYARVGKIAPVWVLIGLMIIHSLSVAISWNGWVSALMLSPLARLYGLWQGNLQRTRVTFIITAIGFGLYSLLASAYVGALNEAILIVSAIIALWRFRTKKTCDISV